MLGILGDLVQNVAPNVVIGAGLSRFKYLTYIYIYVLWFVNHLLVVRFIGVVSCPKPSLWFACQC